MTRVQPNAFTRAEDSRFPWETQRSLLCNQSTEKTFKVAGNILCPLLSILLVQLQTQFAKILETFVVKWLFLAALTNKTDRWRQQ